MHIQRLTLTVPSESQRFLDRLLPRCLLPLLRIQLLLWSCLGEPCGVRYPRAVPGQGPEACGAGRTRGSPRLSLAAGEVRLLFLYLCSLRSPVGFYASENQLSS